MTMLRDSSDQSKWGQRVAGAVRRVGGGITPIKEQ